MKVCSKCGKKEHHAKGLCTSCYHKQDYIVEGKNVYYKENKEKILKHQKEYNEKNIERKKIGDKKYYQEHKEHEIAKAKEWHLNNRERHKKNMKEWHRKNPNYDNEYVRNRLKTDINFKIKDNLRTRIQIAIKIQCGEKAYGTIKLLGCTIQKCREYLENQFKKGMNWDNYGLYGWHIDHIIPCDAFNLIEEEEQLKCFHYTNLQPLWAEENLKKSNKLLIEVETL